MSSILRIVGTTKKYGGDLYDEELQAALALEHDIETFSPIDPRLGKVGGLPSYIVNLKKIRSLSRQKDFVYRPMNHAFFMESSPKQIVSAFHYDGAFCHPLVKLHHYLSLKALIANKENIYKLVVISKYWRDFFSALGFVNIELLYCGFDIKNFAVSNESVEKFKEDHGLCGQKIIYIGNAQKKKGADIVFDALKDSGYCLVTSGTKDLDIPAKNLILNHGDYLKLLKASEVVVTYSQFKEGWNRVAHEAMLMGTPVVGSGLGGMGELLSGGGQTICQHPSELKRCIDALIGNEEKAQQGKEFAEQFTMERFNKRVLEIFT